MKNFILILLVLLAFFAGLYVYSTQKLDIHLTVGSVPVVQPPSPAIIKSIKENLQNATERSAKCPNVLVKSGEVLLLYNNTDTHHEMPVIFNSLDEYTNYVRLQREKGIRCPVLFLDQETSIQGEDVFRIRSTPFNDYYETFSDLVGMTIPAKSGKVLFPPPNVTQFATNVSSSTTMPFYNIEAFDGGMGSPAPFAAPVASPAPVAAPAPSPVVAAAEPAPAMMPQPTTQTNAVAGPAPSSGFVSPYNKGGYPAFDPYGQTIGKYTDLDKIHDSTAAPPLSDNPMDPNWGGTEYTKDAVESGKYIGNTVESVHYSAPRGVQFYPGLHQTYPDPPNYVNKVGGPVPPFLQ